MNIRKWLILSLAILTVMALATYAGVTNSLFVDDEQSTGDSLGIRWGRFTVNDGFENTGAAWDDYWDENGATTWIQDSGRKYSGTYSAKSTSTNNGYLTSDEIEASSASNITVSFRIFIKNIEANDCWIQAYNGTAYNNWYDANSIGSNNAWALFSQVITDPQYLIAGFRLRFDSSLLTDGNDEVNIDDVVITTDTVPPASPTGLGATAGSEQISLDWNDNSEGDLWGYNVYRSTGSGGPYTKINGNPVPNSNYTDTALYGGGTYYYVIRAVDYGNNESGNSSEASATATNAAPSAPTSVNATAGSEQISLGWNPNPETDISGYNVYRGTVGGGPYSKINGSLVATTNYTDTPLYGGGTYYYVVRAQDNGSLESGNSAQTSATATNAAPSAPTSVNATAGSEQISLGWNPNPETDIAGYNVYRGTVGGGPYSKINGSLVVTTNYTDTPLYGGGTYYYVVRAEDNGSLESGNSNEASATASNAAPSAPTGVASVPGSELISLDWNNNVETDLSGYNIYRSTVSGGPYTKINGSPVFTSDYTDNQLYGGGTYYYVIRAQDNGSLESGNSAQTSATATDAAPTAPTGTSATPGNEQISLSWNPNSETDLAGYNVYRATVSGGPYSKINGSLVVTTNYTDTPLYGGGVYYYVVKAQDNGGLISVSFIEASANATNVAPAAPTGLAATPGNEQISLGWNPNPETDLAGYNVYRATVSGGPYSKINGSLVVTTNYTDTPLYGGGVYYYVVKARDNGSLESSNSNEASANATNVAPVAPTSLVATPGDGLVNLNWNDNSETDLAGYNIYRGTVSGNYTKINGSLVTSSNYTNTGLTGNVTYYYVVRAQDNSSLESGNSNEANATPYDNPPAAPTGLTATRGNQKVHLDWNDNSEGDLAGYNVYRSTVSGGPYSKINGSLVTSSNYTNTGLTANVTYYYVVTAEDIGVHESGYSNQASATPWAPKTWTQTSQADFEAGVSTNVTTTLSVGNVILAAGGDAGGSNMILFWDGGAAPSGWTIVSDVGGDFYQRFPRGAATYGGTGGSANHTHNVSIVSDSGPSGNLSVRSGGNNRSSSTHTHPLGSNSTSAASNLPSYRNLQVIRYDSGVPTSIPAGAIAVFDTTPPAGWTQYSAQDNYFVRGEGTANATGGSDSHTHSVSIGLSASTGVQGVSTSPSGGTVANSDHAHSGSGTTASGSNVPPYITVILARADNVTSIPLGMIAMFDSSPTGNWEILSGSGGAFDSRFITGSATYGTTGGSSTSTHSNLVITTGGPSTTAATRTSSANALAASTAHTHNITVAFDSPSTLPPYISVVFAKAQYFSYGALVSQVLDTAITGSEWTELAWDASLPAGTGITLEVRASDISFLKTDTSLPWVSVGSASPVTTGLPSGRYKQWRVILTPNGTKISTPTLQEVRAYYQGD